jgi:malate/lactate dehydrogenase
MSRSGKVTVVGAGFYGSTTALRLAEYDIFESVVLTDILDGKPDYLNVEEKEGEVKMGDFNQRIEDEKKSGKKSMMNWNFSSFKC